VPPESTPLLKTLVTTRDWPSLERYAPRRLEVAQAPRTVAVAVKVCVVVTVAVVVAVAVSVVVTEVVLVVVVVREIVDGPEMLC